MHFPKYWARGEAEGLACWRWSDTSEAEARQEAAAAAQRVAAAFARGESPDRYGYADRPLREMVLEEFRSGDGALAGAITCNAYGATVLNAARALFVDVDLPESDKPATLRPAAEGGSGGFLSRLWGKPRSSPLREPAPAVPAASPAEQAALARVEAWTAGRADGWTWRVYRTAAGLRLLATQALFDPGSPEAEAVFAALGADPLYVRLCRAQKSFRARLSPKPWRLGPHLGRPPAWPWASAEAARGFDDWHARYSAAAQGFATCRLVRTIGPGTIHPDLQPIVVVHDERSRVGINLPLA